MLRSQAAQTLAVTTLVAFALAATVGILHLVG